MYHDYLKENMEIIDCSDLNTRIYMLNIAGLDPDLKEIETILPSERYQKMMSYRNKIDRARLFGNELLFSEGLSKFYPNLKSCNVVRKTDKNGKPYIVDRDNIFFNMSHSGDYAVCAFSDSNIGVDIEIIKEPHLDIANRFFRVEEFDEIKELSSPDQATRFYEYWVLKESFVKSVGLGLQIPFNEFKFCNYGDDLLEVKHQVNDKGYLARVLKNISVDYKLAICKELKVGLLNHTSIANHVIEGLD